MAHHRIFHVRECGADPQFVAAVITSGQSGAVINITVLAARAQTGGAIGTGEAGLGWAGLGCGNHRTVPPPQSRCGLPVVMSL